jgi:hypothetical protein
MNYRRNVFLIAWAVAVLLGSARVAAQVSVDLENKYSNVGAIMVWRVDSSGTPLQLRGFVSGTLIRDRVMVTAGHFTAPAKALGELPPSLRFFASFSPTDAKDPKTWIPVVRLATHPSMPPCPPPPQCDPTHEILVAPLEPGIADVGLVFLAYPPGGIEPARLAEQGRLESSEGMANNNCGIRHDDAAKPERAFRLCDMGWEATCQNFCIAQSCRRDVGALVDTQLRLLRRFRWWNLSESGYQSRRGAGCQCERRRPRLSPS